MADSSNARVQHTVSPAAAPPTAAANSSDATAVLKDPDAKRFFDAAVRERQNGVYRAAIAGFERAIEVEDSEAVWGELALTQFQLWHSYVTALHKDGILALSSDPKSGKRALLAPGLLQEAYNTFIIAMEYPTNKKNPVLLLKLVHLYLEYAAYRGALAVCTLLVEGYTSSKQVSEAIFMSAVTAKALGKHQESAQYLNYLVDKPPHRLGAYQLHLLAAREFDRVAGMQDHAREAYAEAYRAMIALAPVTPSEKSAHEVYKTSRKNEGTRIQLWYQDDNVWFDLAKKMASVNAPLLALSALDVVRQRGGVFPLDVLVLDGVASYRTGNAEAAEHSLAQALRLDYHSKHLRFLLQHWSESWRQQFALEEQSASRIQTVSRSYARRKRWRRVSSLLVEAHHSAASCAIQCAWRGFAARRKLCRLREERRDRERAENAAMTLEDEFVISKHLNAQARKIQALHRIFVAKRERRIREALRERHTTILLDFAVQRAAVGRRHVLKIWALFVQIQRRERSDAAAVIQRSARAHNTRKMVRRLLERRRKQERVIEACVGRKAATTQRMVLADWKTAARALRRAKRQAATKIQSFYRSRLARRRYRVALRRHQLTLDLMRAMVFDRTRRLVAKLWTALSSNAVWYRMQKRKSAIAIQKRVRGMRGRRIAKLLRSRRRRVEAAVRAMRTRSAAEMLRMVLRSLQRNVEMHYEERSLSAIAIQRVYRGSRARRRARVLRECHRMLSSTDLTLKNRPRDFVLRLCFLILARFPEQEASERLRSATRIQRAWRQRRELRRLSAALAKIAKRRAILVRLQASFRALATIFFSETKKLVQARRWRRNRAARKLQRAMRTWLTRRKYARVVEKKALAHCQVQQLERQRRNDWLASVLRAWRKALADEKLEVHRAAARIQRAYRARVAQRQAAKVVAKKAAQARLLASVGLKPLERCFRVWEAVLMERCVWSVRSAQKSSVVLQGDDKRRLASKVASNHRDSRTLEQRAEVPSLLFYTMLNRVRKTGICQLSYSAGASSFSAMQLRQLFELSVSVLCDGGGASGPGHLVEQVVDSMHDSAGARPVQKLIFYNAVLGVAHVAKLSQLLTASSSSSCVVSLVLGNIPLRAGAVLLLAGALCHGHSKLEQLVLEGCAVGSAGAAALAEALCHNKSLWKLDLSRNHISDSACCALGQALLANRQLTVLSLNENDLSDRGVAGFLAPAVEAASSSSRLQQLALRGNTRISVLGRAALQQAVARFNSSSSFATADFAERAGGRVLLSLSL